MKQILDSTIVVIRASNERTFDVCKAICSNQEVASLSIVQECPFEVALRKCYEIGASSNKKWMVTVDGDVLLSGDAIETLVHNAEMMPQNYIQLEGRVFDKITGLYRQAGHRIYRIDLLPRALGQIPPVGSQIRPECSTLEQMGKLGYPSRCIPDVVGLHDFEQSYRDIYRKSFVQAKKHYSRVHKMIPPWEHLAQYDTDYVVASRGFEGGKNYSERVGIDKNADFLAAFDNVLSDLNLQEKDQISCATEIDILWETACYFSHILRFNKREHQKKDARMKVLETEIYDLRTSNSFKLGWALLTPLRFFKDKTQK